MSNWFRFHKGNNFLCLECGRKIVEKNSLKYKNKYYCGKKCVYKVIKRDINYRCEICGEPFSNQKIDDNRVELDHINPKNRKLLPNNFQFAHRKCNRMKSDCSNTELIEWCLRVLKTLS